MGRKRSTCIQYFDLTRDEQSKCEKARCRFCGWVSAKNTVRMKVHLVKMCTDCPEQVKLEFASQVDDPESEGSSEEESAESAEAQVQETSRTSEKRKRRSVNKSQRKKKKRSAPDRSIVQEEHQEIDRALADYLFAANLPLSTLENPYFIAFCKKLRSSYTLPTRHRVVSQSFVQGASAQPPLNQSIAYYSPLSGVDSVSVPLIANPPGISVPLMGTPQGLSLGTHQVPAAIPSLEQQQPGTYHIVRITNT